MEYKKYLPFLLGLAIFVVLTLLVNLVISVVIAVVVALAIYFLLKDKDKSHEKLPEESPLDLLEQSCKSLVDCNIALRKAYIPDELRAAFETVIDKVLEILAPANNDSPDSELTWVINRIATEYLPNKSIKPYLSLNDDDRFSESVINEVKQGLSGIEKELNGVSDILASRKTTEFNAKAKFLKQRFDI